MKKSINVWLQMFAFDKNDADRGASRFLNNMGFIPDSVHALFFHPDFFHLHRGMDEEYKLFKDNCSYRAVPRNTERERQDWTNYELRELVANLKKSGVDFYASIFGVYLEDLFHKEWLSDHKELMCARLNTDANLMCLKRFKDGSYYEDFFIAKVVETLVDYGMAGIHLADNFCPSKHIYNSDYSSDMAEQFIDHTGLAQHRDFLLIGDDSLDGRNTRHQYIWNNLREEWIRFYEWRWETFFRKLCDAVHAVGKQVWIIGMYCSDPFETEYIYGFDTKRVIDAGVDCITANVLPTSVYHENYEFPDLFHKIHLDLPLLRAQIDNGKAVAMLGVQDASEEFSVIDHLPVRLERDIYTVTSFCGRGRNSNESAAEGVFICLGDGLTDRQWSFLKKRIDIGFGTDAEYCHSPTVYWSDHAESKMLREYIATRRPSVHKICTDIFKSGTPFAGSVRSDRLDNFKGRLFVPNFDLLSNDEKADLAKYNGSFVGTVPAGYDLKKFGISPTYIFTDKFSDYPLSAFACGFELTDRDKENISHLCSIDDGKPSRGDEPESRIHPPIAELPFRKLTEGFIKACGVALSAMTYTELKVSASVPMMALHLKSGYERLFLYNPHDNGYHSAEVISKLPILDAKTVSAFPVLPIRFTDKELGHETKKEGCFDFDSELSEKHSFEMKLAPAGLTVVDILIK